MLQYRLTQETNADFEAEGQSLILHITHDDITYEHQLNPMFDCQKIISNINKFDIEYHNEFINAKYNDTTFRLLPVGENIKVILKLRAEIAELRSKISIIMSTLECKKTSSILHFSVTHNKPVQIFENDKESVSLNGYECITNHKYPKWSTYKEFKQLPGFKYFEALDNYKSYMANDDKYGTHSIQRDIKIVIYTAAFFETQSGMVYYVVNPNSYHASYMEKTDSFAMFNLHYFDNSFKKEIPEPITGILDERSADDYKFDSVFYNQYVNSKAAAGVYIPEIIFCHDIKVFTVNDLITHVLFEYIKRYVIGWFILNIDLFIDHKSHVEIEIKQNTVQLWIFRSIKKYGGPKLGIYKTMSIPLIKKIIINDVIYEI